MNDAVAMSRGNADQKPFIISLKGISPTVTSDQYFITKIILIDVKSTNKKTIIFNNVRRSFFIYSHFAVSLEPRAKFHDIARCSSLDAHCTL